MNSRIKKMDLPVLHNLSGIEVSSDDLKSLYTGIDRLDANAIALLFDVELLTVGISIRRFHIGFRANDRYLGIIVGEHIKKVSHQMLKENDENYEIAQKKIYMEKRKEAEVIYGKPKPEINYIVVDGKRFADKDLVNHYEREVSKIVNSFRKKVPEKKLNTIRNVDLSAMRLHRGLDTMQFSFESNIPYRTIIYYEQTPDVVVTKEISDRYISVLNITSRELKKIKECLAGKRNGMDEEDRREIPHATKAYVWKRDKGKCKGCEGTEHLHFHHIKRFSDGGMHQAKNLKLLCVACHALEHYGEPGYGLLKSRAKKLGVTINDSRKTA